MKFENVIRKIDHPPSAQNFARLNEPGSIEQTAQRIVTFALGIPAFNYEPGTKACRDKVQFDLSIDTALSSVARAGAPAGRDSNASFVEAFFAFDVERGYSRARFAPSYDGRYLISREIHVPTKATFTIYENGKLVPVVLCGWRSLALSENQVRLWMTLLESGLFSYGDYNNSPAEVVVFAEKRFGKEAAREPLVIRRGDFDLFSESEMREIAAEFVAAQELALPIARARWEERESRQASNADSAQESPAASPDQPDLFGK